MTTDTGAAQAAEEAANSINEWLNKTFSLGLVNTLIFAAIVAAITFIILKILSKFVKKKLTGNMRIFYHLLYAVVIIVAISSVLMTIEPLKNFATTALAGSGIAAVVLGLAAQTTLGNLFSGISIGISKPFELGDYIELVNQNVTGTVEDIGLRQTVIKTLDGKHVVIPNGVLDKEIIQTSHGLPDQRVTNYLNIGIAYDSDIDLAMKILSEEVAAQKDSIDIRTAQQKKDGVPEVTIRVTDFGPSAVLLRAFVYTVDVPTGLRVLSDLRYLIKKKFEQNGIVIPFQTQNIILKKDETKE
ncbi:MAG: mechanosensitive ion channel family protein [Christensenella sp.]|nr:mechanosensitive ion channel family protein [Christensenella sp.]